ncbi:MAG: phosphoribosylformylglycinamidine synthase [Spirochaetaceae bacterium]|nr:phosphoribosylformylglycinamidine synthase [Spirochaetaceae bacterium]
MKSVYVEKKENYNTHSLDLFHQLKDLLTLPELNGVRILNRYDFEVSDDEVYKKICRTILSEPPVDNLYHGDFPIEEDETAFAVQYLPGQFDQRADSAAQCIQLITHGSREEVNTFRVYILKGSISTENLKRIKSYLINTVDSKEGSPWQDDKLLPDLGDKPEAEVTIWGFINMDSSSLIAFHNDMSLSMSRKDLEFCQKYFRNEEKRNPTHTELKVLDTYWSDHCRHTTFTTAIDEVLFSEGQFNRVVEETYDDYLKTRKYVYGSDEFTRDITLMDMAVIGMKDLRKKGLLDDLDVSEEINACSINIDVKVGDSIQKWLLMFKNETHNHPTEIEPFGGAATCLGGAIRDPLSGRSYVYQAMRLTGSGDPTVSMDQTLKGKLPQRVITLGAAAGYSSYGNQIGIATGHVREVYDDGFIAKRMEIGAVVGAAFKDNVRRSAPEKGDVVILVGGKTGRDGCGGATGSSKVHDEDSVETAGAEVQKGNPPEERKLQRLFRNSKAASLIKRCNDFGAGGVSVAVGELTEGLVIDLDSIPKKYEGLSGTELAISESQERMAVVVEAGDEDLFCSLAAEENLLATRVAVVTDTNRLQMKWNDKFIVDLSRDFLDSGGITARTDITVKSPSHRSFFVDRNEQFSKVKVNPKILIKKWMEILGDLNVCSLQGLSERFDSTIGAGSVLLPFGGKHQLTPLEAMVSKIPVYEGDTTTVSLMSEGYLPDIGKWSPFHGAVYGIVEAVTKIAAAGGDSRTIRLTFQEYFESLGADRTKWGKPFAALLGALKVQKELSIPAIGGKDSMSGSFNDLAVPPTLAAFAVSVGEASHIVSPEFKSHGSDVVILTVPRDKDELPDFGVMRSNLDFLHTLIKEGKISSAHSVRFGGIAEAVSKMCFGNMIGVELKDGFDFFEPMFGSVIVELKDNFSELKIPFGVGIRTLGVTASNEKIIIGNVEISLEEALAVWTGSLDSVFPIHYPEDSSIPPVPDSLVPEGVPEIERPKILKPNLLKSVKPQVCIPVFPGTNCEIDSSRSFFRAGAFVDSPVFRNQKASEIEESLSVLAESINNSQIVMFPGGFSAGDEPDGSGKFIASVFRNNKIADALMDLLNERDGLVLGICNGFQALLKLGLLPYGEIRDMTSNAPTLTFNKIGRHVSRMVRTRVVSTLSPWYSSLDSGMIHTVPVSHGEGRFIGSDKEIEGLFRSGQISSQYVDLNGRVTMQYPDNPNGSEYAVEGLASMNGRIMGKMGHSERIGDFIGINFPGDKDQKIFESGVKYFL